MSTNDEEPYSTIFASLKHPIRRKILRMLSKQPMSFSEMTDALGVSNSFLTYHLESLSELIGKTEDGKYRLSSFGEAADATMNKVEDIPTIAPYFSKKNWFRGRSPVVVALGIVCILLIACFGGTIAYYRMTINNRQNELNFANKTIDQLNATIANQNDTIAELNTTISNLNSQVSSLNSQISSLESVLDATPTTVSELVNDTSVWLNKTVVRVLT
jgi:DNA-binding transcriptional ArsR family regulator